MAINFLSSKVNKCYVGLTGLASVKWIDFQEAHTYPNVVFALKECRARLHMQGVISLSPLRLPSFLVEGSIPPVLADRGEWGAYDWSNICTGEIKVRDFLFTLIQHWYQNKPFSSGLVHIIPSICTLFQKKIRNVIILHKIREIRQQRSPSFLVVWFQKYITDASQLKSYGEKDFLSYKLWERECCSIQMLINAKPIPSIKAPL